jgi:hypothetical protein
MGRGDRGRKDALISDQPAYLTSGTYAQVISLRETPQHDKHTLE